jgi:hypothetical protein
MPDPTIDRLEDQIGWYDRKSNRCQAWYKGLTVVEVANAAFVFEG